MLESIDNAEQKNAIVQKGEIVPMKYTEDTLQFWTSPLSKTEEQRVENTIKMINDAVALYDKLSGCKMDVFAQGSYANNTNVRQNSDLDVCIMLTSTFFCSYVDGKVNADYGYSEGSISFNDYKSYVIKALQKKFGSDSVTVGNKSICIDANSYHVNADAVPAFQYRDYKTIGSTDPDTYVEDVKFLSKSGTVVINYPKDHIKNGIQKNKDTNYEYKKLVRIMKHIRNDMVDAGEADGNKITSFLIECLVWNVPNKIITESNAWVAAVQTVITYLWNAINDGEHKEWGEVSERLYLFHSGRKWTDKETKDFLYAMYHYMEFK